MPSDFRTLLWLLKLGAGVNLYLFVQLSVLAVADPQVVVPGLVLLGVSGFRCLFPNRYVDNVVFHDSPLSSIFLTRVLATFSEVAYIYQFSYVIRVLNVGEASWVNALSWLMVAQVIVSQGFVWGAILTKRLELYFYEELGWLVIFVANTVASAFLYAAAPEDGHILLELNLLFGVGYLPWQIFHLRSLRAEIRAEARAESGTGSGVPVHWRKGLHDAIHQRKPRTDAKAWGGFIGLTWMVAYWASLIPLWVHEIAMVISAHPR
ncbi:MAG TPA: hypothetical protein EYQ54_12940 [Myxococcales bacterium]|nr:hypothetical protein [Myxococcales bacterium]HIL81762.1 hypothetical protein [Myxococcales bacterium]